MTNQKKQITKLITSLAITTILAACTSTGNITNTTAPIENRIGQVDPSTLLGYENAGKPGYHTVRQGETIRKIAAETGQNWRDIIRWNNLENPDIIEIGQVLRIVAPVATATAEPLPLGAGNSPITTNTSGTGAVTVAAIPPSTIKPVSPITPEIIATQTKNDEAENAAAKNSDKMMFAWPNKGSVIEKFNPAKEVGLRGLSIGGKLGDPILAAADGRVVYAGSGLKGYGNLIILKHDNTFITTYSHNKTLLVKEDQDVKKGQKIAEMGQSDADRVKLHFELRRLGKPVDPAKYLPAR